MKRPMIGSTGQPFPLTRPEVSVTPSRARPFAVDCRCLASFGVGLDVGADGWMAWYDPPDWRLTSVSYMQTLRPAEIHGLDGVEIQMLEWEPSAPRWQEGYTHYARLTDSSFQCLAITHIRDGKRIVYTFLDEGFDQDWGDAPRRLEDTGRLKTNQNGSCSLRLSAGKPGRLTIGAGMFRVRIGAESFTCLRSIDSKLNSSSRDKTSLEQTIPAETFHTRSGQVALHRRYNGRLWETGKKASPYAGRPWDERFPDNAHMVINGALFVHWYDCLTDVSCRLGAPKR